MKENKKTLTLSERMKKFEQQSKDINEMLDKLEKEVFGTNAKLDKLGKTVGGINDNIGYHAEQYFQNIFADKLSFGKIKYDYMTPNLKYKRKGEHAEFDIVLFNGKSVAIIEAKSRIHPDFIKEIAEKKTAQFRKYFPLYKDFDLYLGVAGFSFDESVESEAEKYGVGIIRQVGDSVEINDKKLKVY